MNPSDRPALRHPFRTAALFGMAGLAGLVAAVVPATAASAWPRVDLGTYTTFIGCDIDAQSNNQLGYPGTFTCVRASDGRIHQYYFRWMIDARVEPPHRDGSAARRLGGSAARRPQIGH